MPVVKRMVRPGGKWDAFEVPRRRSRRQVDKDKEIFACFSF